jgi:hypothetical protein
MHILFFLLLADLLDFLDKLVDILPEVLWNFESRKMTSLNNQLGSMRSWE